MKLIPAISVKGGHVVSASGHCYSALRNEQGLFRNPANLLKDIPGEQVFVLDIDGVEGRMPNLKSIARMAAHREVWLDAGAPDADSMMDLFVAGATRVALGTMSLDSMDELAAALEISEDIMLAVCCDRGVVSPDPRYGGMAPMDFVNRLAGLESLGSVMLLDLGGLRDRRPPDIALVRALASRYGEVYVSGHIDQGTMEELDAAGAAGVIVDYRKAGELNGRA